MTVLGVCFCAWLAGPLALAGGKPAKKGDGQHSGGGSWGFKRITNTHRKLPRVLLIGDSIANGYHRRVADALKGKANVDLFITPKHVGAPGLLDDLQRALSQGPYRVIHFNESGLHAWEKGRVPEGEYGPRFAEYVKTLKEHARGATLIWASSTPVTAKGKPGQLDAEVNATVVKHNEAARKVVKEQQIAVNDLYALMIDKLEMARGDRWHWTRPGSDRQATAVVAATRKALAAR
jgi:hypothetical protein